MTIAARTLILVLLGAVMAACGDKSEAGQPLVRHAEYLYDFKSLPEMVATSSLVVEGTVSDISLGEVTGGECTGEQEAAGECEGDGAVQPTNVTVIVDEVFFGTLQGGESTVTIIELPTVELLLTPGDAHGFFFLYGEKDGFYSIISPEGRFLVDSEGQISSSMMEADEWIAEIEIETPAEFRQDIREAASDGSAPPATSIHQP